MSTTALQWAFKELTGDHLSKALLVYLALQAKDEDLIESGDGSRHTLRISESRLNHDSLAPRLDAEPQEVGKAIRHLKEWDFIRPELTECKRGHPFPQYLGLNKSGIRFCKMCSHNSTLRRASRFT